MYYCNHCCEIVELDNDVCSDTGAGYNHRCERCGSRDVEEAMDCDECGEWHESCKMSKYDDLWLCEDCLDKAKKAA